MMKGVILGINAHAKIIDITHNIERHNIYEASHVIGMSYKYFPPATIHIVVVDPGVGGERRPLLVITENYYFIGPDNGIFTHIFEKELNNFFKVLHITSSHYFYRADGATFHGRDVFAPVAAWLSKGLDSHKLGEQISDYIKIPLPKVSISDDKVIHGEVVTLDHYGNAITNITVKDLSQLSPADSGSKLKIIFREREIPFLGYYAEADGQTLSATINGFGHLELFVNQNHAARMCSISIGDSVSVLPAN
jgi:S-adenosylmethionine hydrolase